MKKTIHSLNAILITFGLVVAAQSVGAQEWKIFSKPGSAEYQSMGIVGQTEKLTEKSRIGQIHIFAHKSKPHNSEDNVLSFENNRKNFTYSRTGSWDPLPAKSGEENFPTVFVLVGRLGTDEFPTYLGLKKEYRRLTLMEGG